MTPFFYFWSMSYKSLQQCVSDLQKNGEVRIISEGVNPNLDMAISKLGFTPSEIILTSPFFCKSETHCCKLLYDIDQK